MVLPLLQYQECVILTIHKKSESTVTFSTMKGNITGTTQNNLQAESSEPVVAKMLSHEQLSELDHFAFAYQSNFLSLIMSPGINTLQFPKWKNNRLYSSIQIMTEE